MLQQPQQQPRLQKREGKRPSQQAQAPAQSCSAHTAQSKMLGKDWQNKVKEVLQKNELCSTDIFLNRKNAALCANLDERKYFLRGRLQQDLPLKHANVNLNISSGQANRPQSDASIYKENITPNQCSRQPGTQPGIYRKQNAANLSVMQRRQNLLQAIKYQCQAGIPDGTCGSETLVANQATALRQLNAHINK